MSPLSRIFRPKSESSLRLWRKKDKAAPAHGSPRVTTPPPLSPPVLTPLLRSLPALPALLSDPIRSDPIPSPAASTTPTPAAPGPPPRANLNNNSMEGDSAPCTTFAASVSCSPSRDWTPAPDAHQAPTSSPASPSTSSPLHPPSAALPSSTLAPAKSSESLLGLFYNSPHDTHPPLPETPSMLPYDTSDGETTNEGAIGHVDTNERTAVDTAPTQPLFMQDPTWTEGDMCIVTSDGVSFRVESFVIFNASPVLADAHEAVSGVDPTANPPPTKTLVFVDPVFETAAVLSLFLEIATTLEPYLDLVTFTDSLTWGPLFRFLEKWGCDALRRLALDELRSALGYEIVTIPPLCAFYLAASALDAELCTLILKRDWYSKEPESDEWWWAEDGCDSHTYPFAPSQWPTRFWVEAAPLMPPFYLAGLLRATLYYRHGPQAVGKKSPRELAAEAFLAVLDTA